MMGKILTNVDIVSISTGFEPVASVDNYFNDTWRRGGGAGGGCLGYPVGENYWIAGV